MPQRKTQCNNCGHRIRWNPQTGNGPEIFMKEGRCPNCEHHIRSPPA